MSLLYVGGGRLPPSAELNDVYSAMISSGLATPWFAFPIKPRTGNVTAGTLPVPNPCLHEQIDPLESNERPLATQCFRNGAFGVTGNAYRVIEEPGVLIPSSTFFRRCNSSPKSFFLTGPITSCFLPDANLILGVIKSLVELEAPRHCRNQALSKTLSLSPD